MEVHAFSLITFPFSLLFLLHLPAPYFNLPLHLWIYLLIPRLLFILLIHSVIVFYPFAIVSACPVCCGGRGIDNLPPFTLPLPPPTCRPSRRHPSCIDFVHPDWFHSFTKSPG